MWKQTPCLLISTSAWPCSRLGSNSPLPRSLPESSHYVISYHSDYITSCWFVCIKNVLSPPKWGSFFPLQGGSVVCKPYVQEWVSEDIGAHGLHLSRLEGIQDSHFLFLATWESLPSPVNSIQCILILFFSIPATAPPTGLLEPPNPPVPYNSDYHHSQSSLDRVTSLLLL